MNTMEFTKIFGATTAALLVFMLANYASENVYRTAGTDELAYALEIESDAEEESEEDQPSLPQLLASADAAAGERSFRKCAACHNVEQGANAVGPHLWNVVGREVGSVDGFSYSGALGEVAEVWGFEELDAFLANPRGYAPGTSMGFAGLGDPEERANVIVYLNQAGDDPQPLPEPEDGAADQADATEEESAEEIAAEEEPAEETAPEEATEAEAAPEPTEAEAESETASEDGFAALVAAADPASGERLFRRCAACHKLEPGQNAIGPTLHGVVGRDIASVEGFSYSDALKSLEGEWTPERIGAFIENPRGYASGTRMAFAGLKSEEDRAAIIAYLEQAAGG